MIATILIDTVRAAGYLIAWILLNPFFHKLRPRVLTACGSPGRHGRSVPANHIINSVVPMLRKGATLVLLHPVFYKV